MNPRFTSTWKAEAKSLSLPVGDVELITTKSFEKHEFYYSGAAPYLAIGIAGSRSGGETTVGNSSSKYRSFGGCVVVLPAHEKLYGWSQPDSSASWLNIYLGDVGRSGDTSAVPAGLIEKPSLLQAGSQISLLGSRLRDLFDVRNPLSAAHSQALVSLLLFEIQYQICNGADKRSDDTTHWSAHRRERLNAYIDRKLSHDISLSELADLAGMSVSAFLRGFRSHYGVTPHRYLVLRRLARAKELVAKSSLSMTDIALETGFSSASHFSAAFRQEVGVPPRAFRAASFKA